MTSSNASPARFTRIDDLTRPRHHCLSSADRCLYIGEYTPHGGYQHGATNQLIFNFKKPMNREGKPEWRHKQDAITQLASMFRHALSDRALNACTFVPIPPSKVKGDPLHDDRMTQMLRTIRPNPPLDIRELIVQTQSTEAAHSGSTPRPSPSELELLYEIDEALADPTPEVIAIVDDVLTTGAHFKAAANVLSARFADARIIGLFCARSV